MTIEEILNSLQVSMPSVTSWGVERLVPPAYSLDSDSLDYVNSIQDDINAGLGKSVSAQFDNTGEPSFLQKTSTVANILAPGVIGGLNGAIGMNSVGQQLNHMYGDQSVYNTQIANMQAQIRANNETLDQALAMQGYNIPRQTAEDVRGLTEEQRKGLIGASGLHGLSAGASVGSAIGSFIPGGKIIGGIAGGIIGGIHGLVQGRNEDKNAQLIAQSKADYANYNADMLDYNLAQNREADINRIQYRDNAQKTVRAVANGGKIARRQMDIHEFAGKVLGKKDYPDRPVRRMTKGGVMLRFKVK